MAAIRCVSKDMGEEENSPLWQICSPISSAPNSLPLRLGGRFDLLLGQSLHPAQPHHRLSRLSQHNSPRHLGRRQAALSNRAASRPDLRRVHGGLRHAQSQRGKGAARGASQPSRVQRTYQRAARLCFVQRRKTFVGGAFGQPTARGQACVLRSCRRARAAAGPALARSALVAQ
jgi:hypothetical protein